MSDRHLYSRLLLAKGHGYPLSYPQPPDDLPLETRAKGIQIGDVGVLTTGGGFDTFFNICHPPDDARNRFGVPDGFETVDLDPSKDVWSGERYHRPGSHVSNAKITKRRLQGHTDVDNVFLPLVAGAAIEISTASKQAAVLLMPDGASRLDLRFKEKFRQQALKHARCWYAFLKSLGSMVENGELYLVTGVDNSSSWILGAAENQSQDGNISLKLKAAQIGSTGGSYAWQWEANGAFTDSGPRRPPGEDPRTENQTVFLRGFRIAIHSVAWKKIAQAIPVVDEKRLTFLKKRWFSSFVQSTSLGSISQGSKSTTQIDVPPEEVDTVELSPATVRPYHPADAINNYLLCSTSLSNSDIAAAATHDDEWICALNEDEETLPTETELLKRISGKCTVSFADGGKYFQVIKHESSLDNLTALPHPGSAPPTQGSISSSPVNLGRLSRSLGRLSGSLGVLRLSHLTRPFVQNEMVPPFQPSLDNFKKAYDKYTNPAEIELARAHRRVSAARREAEPRDPVCSICFSRCRISPNPWQCTFNDRMELDDSDDEANLKPRKPMTHGLRLASCKHYFCGTCLAQAIYLRLNLPFDRAAYGTVLGPQEVVAPGLHSQWPIYCPTCAVKPGRPGVPISDVTALQVLGKPNIEEWDHAQLLAKLIQCPHKGCGERFDPPDDAKILIQCPWCGGSLCKACKCVWHENMTCERYQAHSQFRNGRLRMRCSWLSRSEKSGGSVQIVRAWSI